MYIYYIYFRGAGPKVVISASPSSATPSERVRKSLSVVRVSRQPSHLRQLCPTCRRENPVRDRNAEMTVDVLKKLRETD